MFRNTYEGVVDRWKVDLIRERARRWGFRREDLEDAEQEIILDVADFRFDAAKSNGATERTALTAIIDHRLCTLLRSKRRYQQHVAKAAAQVAMDDEPLAASTNSSPNGDLVLDMQEAVAALPDFERAICQSLALGHSLTEIAAQLGCSRHAVGKAVARIRLRFESLGLGDWIRG
jgi:RNA polymerase sigma factor (sigma-70 family)